jgi:hypothetical protein
VLVQVKNLNRPPTAADLADVADFLAHEMIVAGRAKPAMIRVRHKGVPVPLADVVDPGLVVVEVLGDDLTRI